MEDTFIHAEVDSGDLYVVFDGHGGQSVSAFCEMWFTEGWRNDWKKKQPKSEEEIKKFIDEFLPAFDEEMQQFVHGYGVGSQGSGVKISFLINFEAS